MQQKRRNKYSGCGIGRKGRGVLNWTGNTYSVKYRNPWKFDAYKQQGIGRIIALPPTYCDDVTFIAANDMTFNHIDLLQADGYIFETFFDMDENGDLFVVGDYENYFELDSETGMLINKTCE